MTGMVSVSLFWSLRTSHHPYLTIHIPNITALNGKTGGEELISNVWAQMVQFWIVGTRKQR